MRKASTGSAAIMGKRRQSKQDNAQQRMESTSTFNSRLATMMLAKGLVTSPAESISLAEAILAEIEESELSREQALIVSMEDYFSMSTTDATGFLSHFFESDDDSSLECHVESRREEDGDLESDQEGEWIGEGECELCERFIGLTKHHLIPRSTWPKILPRLTNAARALAKDDVHRAGLILGPGMHHFLEPLARTGPDKPAIRLILRRTTDICRPCHAAVHRAHDNMELANNFGTVELLAKNDKISKFAKWASKQRAGKRTV